MLCSPCAIALSSLLAPVILLAATGAAAAPPVMTFTASAASTGIAGATGSQWEYNTFIEDGDRYNFAYTLRDEVVIENGFQYTHHYRDVTYDVAGAMRDSIILNLDGTASGAHSVRFSATGTLDATQGDRLVESGDLSFQIFLSLAGNYAPQGAGQPPGPPVFMDMSSGTPQTLAAITVHDPDELHYHSSLVTTVTAPRDLISYDVSYLIEGGGDLLSNQAGFAMWGPAYDAGVRNLGYSEFLGTDVIPIPEPAIWAMLLAGVGVLGLARPSRPHVFKP